MVAPSSNFSRCTFHATKRICDRRIHSRVWLAPSFALLTRLLPTATKRIDDRSARHRMTKLLAVDILDCHHTSRPSKADHDRDLSSTTSRMFEAQLSTQKGIAPSLALSRNPNTKRSNGMASVPFAPSDWIRWPHHSSSLLISQCISGPETLISLAMLTSLASSGQIISKPIVLD